LQRLLRQASMHAGEWPKVSIWQGLADYTVAPSNADAVAVQWQGVHGVAKAPTFSQSSGRRSKRVWHNAAGESVVEVNMIDGMGHGTPLGGGLGSPGPYMLDVGVSSTREIARFWGIESRSTGSDTVVDEPRSTTLTPDREDPERKPPAPPSVPPSGPDSGSNAHGVRKVIEDALRAAGLMR
jgi:hypothetical protein